MNQIFEYLLNDLSLKSSSCPPLNDLLVLVQPIVLLLLLVLAIPEDVPLHEVKLTFLTFFLILDLDLVAGFLSIRILLFSEKFSHFCLLVLIAARHLRLIHVRVVSKH